MCEVRDCASGKGRGLFATCDVPAGFDIVTEAPFLLTVAPGEEQHYCAHCLRTLPKDGVQQPLSLLAAVDFARQHQLLPCRLHMTYKLLAFKSICFMLSKFPRADVCCNSTPLQAHTPWLGASEPVMQQVFDSASQSAKFLPCSTLDETCCAAGHMLCPETQQACFCGAPCAQAAEQQPGAPSLAVRKALAAVAWGELDADQKQQVRILMQAAALRQHPTAWSVLMDSASGTKLPQPRQQQFMKAVQVAKQGMQVAIGGAQQMPSDSEMLCILMHDATNSYGVHAASTPEVCHCSLSAVCKLLVY